MDDVLTPFEAESYVDQLRAFEIKNVGSSKWLQQHEFLEKLNVQMHINAGNETDEFVLEHLVSYEKIPVLIHELIATEVWKERVYPELKKLDFAQKSTMTPYMCFYHEATIISLLEAVLYHKDAVEACGDSVLDLAEYCVMQLVWLCSIEPPKYVKPDPKAQIDMVGTELLEDQIKTLPFEIAVKATAIIRYLTDNVATLPLSTLTRMLNVHDLPCLVAPLISSPPWTRVGKDGKPEKFYDSAWNTVEDSDRMRVTRTEAQAWLTMYNLIQDPECARKYEYTSHNKNQILKIRGHFNEVLIDQLPVLGTLRRTIEELAVMEPPPPTSSVVVEQLPEIKVQLEKINSTKWKAIAEYQVRKVFVADEATMQAQAKRLAETYNLDVLESLLPEDPKCGKCGEPAVLRCSKCRNEWYCRRQCQVEDWKVHKKMCKVICENEPKIQEASD